MICSERTIRLPGMPQALAWLRSSLPESPRAPTMPGKLTTLSTAPPRRRPAGSTKPSRTR